MRNTRVKPLLFVTALAMLARPVLADDGAVRINEIQVIGTHNSYHAGLAPSAGKLLQKAVPQVYAELNYSHPSLTRQLDEGVRQVELDIYADADGGRYSHPAIDTLIAQAGLPADPPTAAPGVMEQPGFKVMHVQDVDQHSVCQPFVACLAELRAWSKAHPGHTPLFVLVETKEEALTLSFPTVKPEPFTPAVLDALDHDIGSVFPRSEIITPDSVRGRHATLNEAVSHGGWPTLAKTRGKVLFMFDHGSVSPAYEQGHAGLRGRLVFTDATPGDADAAFVECNECSVDRINALVQQGYLVRTRADDPAVGQAVRNDTTRRDIALASGAQIISTDYPVGETAASGYAVGLPGHAIAHCNPLLKPAGCVDADLEH